MSIHPHAIELDGGIVRSSVIKDAAGEHIDWSSLGEFHFYVDLIEEDGGRIGLWSGTDYGAAITEAERARREWEIEEPVRDRIVS